MRGITRYLLIPALQAALLSLVLLGVGAVYLQVNVWAAAQDRYEEQEKRKRQLTNELRELRRRAELANGADKLAEAADLLSERLGRPFSQAELISKVNTLARRSNVRVVHSSNRLEQSNGPIFRFVQDITLQGPYADVRYFMELLQSLEAVTLVDEMDWSRAKAGVIKARLVISTYFNSDGDVRQ